MPNRDLARLTQLIANLEGGVLVEDENRHVVLVNQRFCDLFKLDNDPDTLIGQHFETTIAGAFQLFDDPQAIQQWLQTVLQNQEVVSGEKLILTDGRVISCSYQPVSHKGQHIGHMWHCREITAEVQSHKRIERLLQFEAINREIIRLFLQLDNVDDVLFETLAMTGVLLDVSRVYVFRFRENERILDNTHEWCSENVKPEIENLQGLPFDELVPSFFPLIAERDLIAPKHIDELPDDIHDMLEPQDIKTILWVPIHLDNRIEGFIGYDEIRHAREWLPEEITMARIIAESYARALERERAAADLIKARDEAVRTAQLRAQFVANMSHEIRTPMTGILGMLELLLETSLDELQHEFASEAFNSSSRLLNIINDILDFSKLEAGQIVLESSPIDLKAVATEVKMTLEPQIKDKELRIDLRFDEVLPYRLYGDATRIRQVLMNLVGNAVKFTQTGHVTIDLQVASKKAEVAYVRFAVTDTGIGIAPEKLDQIFESFVQADGSITRKFGGSGLGLSISKQLVELMGGELQVESTPEQGSTFSFMLRMPIAETDSTRAETTTHFDQLSVLVVDDDRTARYVLSQQLETWGIQVAMVDQTQYKALLDVEQYTVIFRRYHTGMKLENRDQLVHIVDKSTPMPDENMVALC